MAARKVSILGLGLIGTSLGLALKARPDAPQVVGFDIAAESLRRASRMGAIDRSCGTLREACSESETVVLATPVRASLTLLPDIAPHVQPDTLVTDTCATKRDVTRVAATALPPHAVFVGGHPLAGPLTAAVDQPSATLFHGATYCLTPSADAPGWAVEEAIHLVERVGAQPLFLDPDEHDSRMAAVSHLPHYVSVALVNTLATQSSWEEASSMAAGGFRAASVLADADPQVWADVATTNRDNVCRQLDLLIERLGVLRDLIAAGDDALLGELTRARSARQAWAARRGDTWPAPRPTPAAPERAAGWISRLRKS
ncbi:MAG: prephenate dehydrogenase/arogenate dehydrogenase family protein [Chloroflexi bacterium]|nr:prephenate dehydrogenase/arogenate dehydrogenase family protein [Chloroflexota bacterium]